MIITPYGYVLVGVHAVGWHSLLNVPITQPFLLGVNKCKVSNTSIGWCGRVQVVEAGQRLEQLSHRWTHSMIWLGDAEHVWRAVHAFGSMLNTALANALLATELLFWYQLSNRHFEWVNMPVGRGNSNANGAGGIRTTAEKHLELPAGQAALPRAQNASHVLIERYPLPLIVPLLPVYHLWLQSLLVDNYSLIVR